MILKMKEKKEIKKKNKGTAGRIAGKIIATLMAIFMLVASCSTLIYYVINS